MFTITLILFSVGPVIFSRGLKHGWGSAVIPMYTQKEGESLTFGEGCTEFGRIFL